MLDRYCKFIYDFFMEIRVLKYFLTVAREGTITGAANYLHLTQPTLSRQLQDLEKELGQKLIIRGMSNKSSIIIKSLFASGLSFRITSPQIS